MKNDLECLNPLIDQSTLECLNEDEDHPLKFALLQSNDALFLQSANDPQLLIKFEFTQPVKLYSLRIRGNPLDGSAPTSIKLFTNNLSMGFSDAESSPPIQQLSLSDEDLSGSKDIPLRFVKFQNIKNLIVFIEENGGAEFTKVMKIELIGQRSENMDMNGFKPVKG